MTRTTVRLLVWACLAISLTGAARATSPLPDFGALYNGDGDVMYGYLNTTQNTTYIDNLFEPLRNTPIKTVSWSIACGSDIMNYPTQVANNFGWRTTSYDSSPDWANRISFGRAWAQQGYDPVMVTANKVKSMGKYFIPSYRMNDDHFVVDPYNYPLTGSFWLNNTNKTIGTSPMSGYDYSNLLSYAYPEVRNYRLSIINEAIDRYANVSDGFELDFNRVQIFFSPGTAQTNAPLITSMVQQVRQKLDQVAASTGRPQYLFVRVPPAMANNQWAGLEVDKWIQQRLVDVVLPSQLQTLAHDMPIAPFVSDAQASGAKVYPSLYPRTNYGYKFVARPPATGYTGDPNYRVADAEQTRGAIINYRYMGASGFQVYNYGLPMVDWGFTAAQDMVSATPTLGKDRVFAVTPSYFTDPEDTFEYAKQVPYTVSTFANKDFTMIVGDDISQMIRERPQDVILRLGLTGTQSSRPITVTINGHQIHSGTMGSKYFSAAGLGSTSDGPVAYFQTAVDDLLSLQRGNNTIRVSNTSGLSSLRITDIQLGVFGASVPGAFGAQVQTKRQPQSSMLRQVYTDNTAGNTITYTVNDRTNNGYDTGGGGVYMLGQTSSGTVPYNHVAGFTFDQAMYYPSVEGDLNSLSYQFWMSKTSSTRPTSFVSVMCMQDGKVYTLVDKYSIENSETLTSKTIQGWKLNASKFLQEKPSADGLVLDYASHPNFSASGSPLYFGFMLSRAANPSSGGNDQPRTDLDDLIINFNGVATPWAKNGSGDWNAAANWSGLLPNWTDAMATLGNVITSPQFIYTNAPVTLGTLKFDSAYQYQFGGSSSLSIDVSGGAGSIQVVRGSHKINLPLFVNDNTTMDVFYGATLTIADPIVLAAGTTLSKVGDGTLRIISTVSGSGTLSLGSGVVALDLESGTAASASAPAAPGPALSVPGAQLLLGANQILSGLDAVTSNPGDQAIDLAGTIVRIYAADRAAATEQAIYDDIRSAKLSASGRDGIYDSSAGSSAFAVGLTDRAVDAHGDPSVLVRLTVLGDANVDGMVNITDLGLLATAWQMSGLWDNGDFNYDGLIDISDLGILATHWQGGSAGGLDQALQSLGLSNVTVPEPASLVVLLTPVALLVRRRRCDGWL